VTLPFFVIASLAQRGAAIQSRQAMELDCFAALAMTTKGRK
jgi:hypothetical protein